MYSDEEYSARQDRQHRAPTSQNTQDTQEVNTEDDFEGKSYTDEQDQLHHGEHHPPSSEQADEEATEEEELSAKQKALGKIEEIISKI